MDTLKCVFTGIEKFPECLSFVKEHSLYTEALGSYGDRSSDEYKVIEFVHVHNYVSP